MSQTERATLHTQSDVLHLLLDRDSGCNSTSTTEWICIQYVIIISATTNVAVSSSSIYPGNHRIASVHKSLLTGYIFGLFEYGFSWASLWVSLLSHECQSTERQNTPWFKKKTGPCNVPHIFNKSGPISIIFGKNNNAKLNDYSVHQNYWYWAGFFGLAWNWNRN